MEKLYKKNCMACDGNATSFDIGKIHKYLKKINGWEVKKSNKNSYYLEKKFKFKNFIKSQEFINKISKIAELQSHHPDIHFGWGYAKIKIFTHAIGGLRENDFILASKIDQI
jgi:4a-hydroxytetrahydrobiopterin dehydratase